jgi:hypothetical protein
LWVNTFVGKLEGKRTLGRPARRWEGILKWILKIGCAVVDWFSLVQDRDQDLANTLMYLQVAKKDGKFLEQTSDYQLFKDSVQ